MKSPCLPVNLQCEFLHNPLGIGETRPRLSWRLKDARPGARQTAYRIHAASTAELLKTAPDLWDTGIVKTDDCLDIEYAGKKIGSRSRVWWRVKVWDLAGDESPWGATDSFEIGLLNATDWKGGWITDGSDRKKGELPSPLFRREFPVEGTVAQARLYITSRGLFEARINGARVGEDFFTPGWTDYRKRIYSCTYDVTGLITRGDNAIGVSLGDGWHSGYLVWENNRCVYGNQLALCAQLEITYGDGTVQTIATGPTWKSSTGAIRSSDIYNGETFDARLAAPGWASPGFDDTGWKRVNVAKPTTARVVPRNAPLVRAQEELKPVVVTKPVPGTYVFNLGQNIVGWARIKIRGKKGRTITVRYAEMLNADGTLYTANLRTAKVTDRYICAGTGNEVWKPTFTFHGFQYVEITGLDYRPRPDAVTGVVLHSQMPQTGWFKCSDPLVNRLQENIRWGQKGNFLDVPTDCPQRDERLGWTGDAQVFAPTACFNHDAASFFEKWCVDIADSQTADGRVPHVVPNVFDDKWTGAAAWGDAGVIVPWMVYQAYADRRLLERQYPSMKKWVDWWTKHTNERNARGIAESTWFGDWLAIDIGGGDAGRAPTPRDLISTAYYAHTAAIVAKSAAILGKTAEAKSYAALNKKVAAAFNREFVSPNGRVTGDTQTAYLLALGFDLLPADKQPAAVARLIELLQSRGWHLTTGFVGTPLLAPVLTKIGRTDAAYKLLLQKTYPGWLYPVLNGATTMWERWNSYTKEKGFGDAGMNSFNHYAYGSIGEWMYQVVGGIDLDPQCPGYKRIICKPQPGEGITWAKTRLETRFGTAACSWKIVGKKMTVEVTVPPNTTATVILPGKKGCEVTAGVHVFSARVDVVATDRKGRK